MESDSVPPWVAPRLTALVAVDEAAKYYEVTEGVPNVAFGPS